MYGPGTLPAATAQRLSTAVQAAMKDPAFQSRLAALGLDSIASTPEQLATAQRTDDLLDIEAGLHREDDPLGDPEVGAGQDHLVDRLDRLAGTDRADMRDGPPERGEHGSRSFHVGRIAPDEDRQRGVARALAATRHGCVDHREIAVAEPRGEVPRT